MRELRNKILYVPFFCRSLTNFIRFSLFANTAASALFERRNRTTSNWYNVRRSLTNVAEKNRNGPMEEKGTVFVCVISENYRTAYDKWRNEWLRVRMISVWRRGVTGSDRCTRTTTSAPICPSADNYACSLIAFRTPTFSAIHSSAAGTEALLDLRQFRSIRNRPIFLYRTVESLKLALLCVINFYTGLLLKFSSNHLFHYI